MKIPILFTMQNSNYALFENADCYDIKRDALTCTSDSAFVAHPPCRSWGRLRKFANVVPGEHLLAVWSVFRLWRYGGVLEHPAGSGLWKLLNLPLPGSGYDFRGGFSISFNQSWFGFKCEKNTWLYIVGCSLSDIPSMPLNFNAVSHTICSTSRATSKKEISKNKRSETVPALCEYLISICEIINFLKITKI